jgi:hypothetical protein
LVLDLIKKGKLFLQFSKKSFPFFESKQLSKKGSLCPLTGNAATNLIPDFYLNRLVLKPIDIPNRGSSLFGKKMHLNLFYMSYMLNLWSSRKFCIDFGQKKY